MKNTVLTVAPLLLVAAGLIQDRQGRFLLSQRKAHGHMGSLWEFPGGKVQIGETPEAALVREMREELDIEVENLTPWTFVSHDYDTFHLLMVLFHCGIFRGTPCPLDVQNIGWFTAEEMQGLDFPPADQPLLKQLPSG